MAHNISERDGLFVVREPAWHGLGEVLSEYPTREQAQQIAHPWDPQQEPIYRRRYQEQAMGSPRVVYEEIPEYLLNVRDDTDQPIGVVSSTWTPVTNGELYDIAGAIEGEATGSVMYETGGSLKGGRKVWLLLRLREPLVVVGDPNGAVIPYYALQNAHDGSASFRGQCTMTRIVCDNTAQMADLDASARGTEFVFRHTSSIHDRIEQAKQALAGWRESLDDWRLFTAHLMDTRLSDHAVVLFVEKFIPMPAVHTVSKRVVDNVETGRLQLRQILGSETCEGIRNTAWGCSQAAVEYLNHSRRANSKESRFKRAYLDRNDIVNDAVNLALELADA